MPSFDLNKTFGALLIGVFMSAVLFGVTCTQVFFYFQHSSDGIVITSSVILLLILETLHSAFGIHAVYYYTILNYLNPPALVKDIWSGLMTLGISTGIIFVVHLFYIRRVYYMSRKNVPLVLFITALATAHFATSVAVSARAFESKLFASFPKIIHLVDSSLALAVVSDVGIAVTLSYYLHTSRSGIESTDTMINKLMMYTVNNGILTSVFDIIVLVFVTTEVDNLIFMSIFQVVGNLYTNSMIATLNSRNSVIQASRRSGQEIDTNNTVEFKFATASSITNTLGSFSDTGAPNFETRRMGQ